MTKEEIKSLRQSLNLTQEAFARLLDVSLRSVAGWEAGKSRPTGLYLKRILEIERENSKGK